jgi:arginyl-tRNA synthetase
MEISPSVLAQVKKDIATRVMRAISKAQDKGELPKELCAEVKMETPPRPEQGDFATGVAMALGRHMKTDGRSVAGTIVRHLNIDDSPVLRVDIAGPGFLNFFLDTGWLQKAMSRVWAEGPSYGRTDYLNGEKILLEFVSANPTGPLNVVNARAAAVGDCLASMLEMAGAQVSREFYINDAGNQTDVLGDSLEARYRQVLGQDSPLPENAYKGEYLKDLAQELVSEKGHSLLELADDERHAFFKSYALQKILEWQKKTLQDYGLTFDTWFSEKSLRDAGAHNLVVELLRTKGLTYDKDGAVWFRSTDFGDDKDRVLVKSDENATATYIVPDLAYHKNKLERGFNHLIDILGPDHHGYVNRLAAGLMGLGYPKDVLEVLIVQVVRLVKGKELVKMSKRGGEFISMDELLEDVGKDAARFFFLMRSPESHLDFDIDLARLQSNENPVFYVQYAHARIASIFRQAKDDGFKFAMGPNEIDFSLLRDPSELALMKIIATFPEEVHEIAKAREPNRLIKYMMDLATAFHAFYTRCRVLGEDPALTAARLYLAKLAQIVLANALRLTGISAPESM